MWWKLLMGNFDWLDLLVDSRVAWSPGLGKHHDKPSSPMSSWETTWTAFCLGSQASMSHWVIVLSISMYKSGWLGLVRCRSSLCQMYWSSRQGRNGAMDGSTIQHLMPRRLTSFTWRWSLSYNALSGRWMSRTGSHLAWTPKQYCKLWVTGMSGSWTCLTSTPCIGSHLGSCWQAWKRKAF